MNQDKNQSFINSLFLLFVSGNFLALSLGMLVFSFVLLEIFKYLYAETISENMSLDIYKYIFVAKLLVFVPLAVMAGLSVAISALSIYSAWLKKFIDSADPPENLLDKYINFGIKFWILQSLAGLGCSLMSFIIMQDSSRYIDLIFKKFI
jgi:hypothetical protein